MQGHNRRVFMLHAVAGTTALTVPNAVLAQAATDAVKETDPYPKSMGFKLNTANVDQAKFPRHAASQKCSECQLFSTPTGGEKLGTCSFFKRLVPPEGWCRNFKPRKAA
ncbi:MAG: high-potential iron-sulfur protein [Burkholderiales bacterium]